MHLHDVPARDEEVLITIPGGPKTAIAVPLDALSHFLPLLDRAVQEQPPARCPACSAVLPAGVCDD